MADLHLDPEPIGEQELLPVVPVSDSLDADVTVANRGTVRAVAVTVILELVVRGRHHRATFEQEIAVLEPGALTTVSLPRTSPPNRGSCTRSWCRWAARTMIPPTTSSRSPS